MSERCCEGGRGSAQQCSPPLRPCVLSYISTSVVLPVFVDVFNRVELVYGDLNSSVVLCVGVRSAATVTVMCVRVVVDVVDWAVVTTLAGGVNGTIGAFGDGSGSNANFSYPWGVAVDASGNVFVGDHGNHRIRKVTAGGGTLISQVIPSLHACVADNHVGALA